MRRMTTTPMRGAAMVLGLCVMAVASGRAQGTRLPAPSDTAELAAGWNAMARGDLTSATAAAVAALGRHPESVEAASLLVEASTRRVGALAGLDAYEQWLGPRQLDAPYLLRVVVLGALRESARATEADAVRRGAYQFLLADRDAATLAASGRGATSNDLIELELAGRLGSEPAVRRLIAALKSAPAERLRIIASLAETRSPLAVAPLVSLSADADAGTRVAAAHALGRLGAAQAVPALRALLKDSQFDARFAAASALYRLRDGSGFAVLREAQASPSPMIRAARLDAISADVDAAWLTAARELLAEPDARVRLLVARLIAPHDIEAARAALQALMAANEPDVRGEAGRIFVERLVADYPTLRRFLRADDPLTRVQAAARVLELTR